jgi:hypothetical protein
MALVLGDDGTWTLVDGSGATVASFTEEAVNRAKALAEGTLEREIVATEDYVMFSPDGRSWSASPVAELLDGQDAGFASSITVADTVRVTVALPDPDPEDGVVPKAVLVGTPG